MESNGKSIHIRGLLGSLCIVAGLFICYRLFTDFTYLTNDDMYLQAIVSGELSGQPDAHMIYSNYLLGILLSSFYRWAGRIPWYGLYLCGVCLLCHWVILYRCIRKFSKSRAQILVSIIFCIISFSALFRHIAMIQYTVVAAFAGATAVFYALTMDMEQDRKVLIREYSLIFLLAALSILIREKVFFMLVPFAACGWLAKWLTEKEKSKTLTFHYGILLAGILGMALLLVGADRMAYKLQPESRADWEEYRRYNTAREQILDYYHFPDYDANEDFYQELGIDNSSYVAVSQYYCLLPQPVYDAKTMENIAQKAVKIRKEQQGIADRLKETGRAFMQCNLTYSDRPLNLVVYAAWLCLLVYAVCSRNRKIFLWLGFLFAARIGTWGFILYRGRYPDRITQSLYLAELLMLCATFLTFAPLYRQFTKWKKLVTVGSLMLSCLLSLYIGIPKAMAVKGENAGNLFFGTSYQQLKDYCAKEQGHLYLMDMNSAANYHTSIFKPAEGSYGVCENLIPLGSWPVKSPLIDQTIKKYQIEDIEKDWIDNENVFFVFKDSEVTPSAYLAEMYNAHLDDRTVELQLVDCLKMDAGINFNLYQLVTKK